MRNEPGFTMEVSIKASNKVGICVLAPVSAVNVSIVCFLPRPGVTDLTRFGVDQYPESRRYRSRMKGSMVLGLSCKFLNEIHLML